MTVPLDRLIENATSLGIELDRTEAAEWLAAMDDSEADALQVDAENGVFGHRVALLDFDPEEVERLRRIGRVVGIESAPPEVETALALAGSLAQNRIQANPGDCDFFQRVNLPAPSRREAADRLADVMRDKVFAFAHGPGYHLNKIQMGSWPVAVWRDGRTRRAGSPISWTLDEVRQRRLVAPVASGEEGGGGREKGDEGRAASGARGETVEVTWGEAAHDPGWTKLDWIIADDEHGGLVSASNVIDVTWEAPDGSITPLDGFLDTYFQEVYLDAEAMPVFAKLAGHVSDDALGEYVEAMEYEATKYLQEPANYGKAAKRMYNLFRYAGRHAEAVYLRELFDEPATALYGVAALLDTLDEAMKPGSTVAPEAVADQTDRLILTVIDVLEGDDETEIVKRLLQLRTAVSGGQGCEAWTRDVKAARDRVYVTVNTFFRDRLEAVPAIRAFIAEAQKGKEAVASSQ